MHDVHCDGFYNGNFSHCLRRIVLNNLAVTLEFGEFKGEFIIGFEELADEKNNKT